MWGVSNQYMGSSLVPSWLPLHLYCLSSACTCTVPFLSSPWAVACCLQLTCTQVASCSDLQSRCPTIHSLGHCQPPSADTYPSCYPALTFQSKHPAILQSSAVSLHLIIRILGRNNSDHNSLPPTNSRKGVFIRYHQLFRSAAFLLCIILLPHQSVIF